MSKITRAELVEIPATDSERRWIGVVFSLEDGSTEKHQLNDDEAEGIEAYIQLYFGGVRPVGHFGGIYRQAKGKEFVQWPS